MLPFSPALDFGPRLSIAGRWTHLTNKLTRLGRVVLFNWPLHFRWLISFCLLARLFFSIFFFSFFLSCFLKKKNLLLLFLLLSFFLSLLPSFFCRHIYVIFPPRHIHPFCVTPLSFSSFPYSTFARMEAIPNRSLHKWHLDKFYSYNCFTSVCPFVYVAVSKAKFAEHLHFVLSSPA